MELIGVVERLEGVVSVCGSPDASPAELRAALAATTQIRGFIDARRAELVHALGEHPAAFPEATIAETSGCSLNQASKETERARTLSAAASMADALSNGSITSGHVDALTRAARSLDEAATASLLGADVELALAASRQSVAQFDGYIKKKAKALDRSDGEARLERQKRATRLRTWTDEEGMWNLKGRFDPQTGVELAHLLSAARSARSADHTPDSAPADAFERSQYLDALALASLMVGDSSSGSRPGPPLVVVDATRSDGAGGPVVDWGIPVELPASMLAEVFDAHEPDVVVVRNGVILRAPGRLDLGRSSRLANRAQRRALRGLYASCAVPDCAVHYDRCRLHHVEWWEHGGTTDLANLLPVCQHHHTRLHDDRWNVMLGPNRELTIELPDGQVMRTGPPTRGDP